MEEEEEEEGELERKAVQELLTEAKRGKARAESMGPMGWMKCPLPGANKRFLVNTIKNTLLSSRQACDTDQGKNAKESDQNKKEWRKKEKTLKSDYHHHKHHPYKQSSKTRLTTNRSPSRRERENKKRNSTNKH
ncbi:uncharacterized LOC103183253 [Callorhinchus milii]|uniref:Polymerase (RNA) I polypeptide D n=1 Tax=Callorhinchus milii TaxID=7868 RepID=K4FUQ6_CALMI|nr:uncharacterized LOC103183253 [Callorhinchus milii]AFK11309.1 polymerase (RNA) I polypeptide D [Callorhinchus milii]|eukprot:gi/632965265/ref/XP_007898803.1/ PREDICTED: DNA-directed RNA polymerases I and III subunit RPAC2 [Callorhinchus milii]